jgi:hypothetical protein
LSVGRPVSVQGHVVLRSMFLRCFFIRFDAFLIPRLCTISLLVQVQETYKTYRRNTEVFRIHTQEHRSPIEDTSKKHRNTFHQTHSTQFPSHGNHFREINMCHVAPPLCLSITRFGFRWFMFCCFCFFVFLIHEILKSSPSNSRQLPRHEDQFPEVNITHGRD